MTRIEEEQDDDDCEQEEENEASDEEEGDDNEEEHEEHVELPYKNLKRLRRKIVNEGMKYLKQRRRRPNVNYGASVIGGIHAIAMSLLLPNDKVWVFDDTIHTFVPLKKQDAKDVQQKNTVSPSNTSFPNVILHSILYCGYDTDTVASIAGAILGARFATTGKSEWIPVNKHCVMDHGRIVKYANFLVLKYRSLMVVDASNNNDQAMHLETIEEFVQHEQNLSLFGCYAEHKLLDMHAPRPDGNKRVFYHSIH